MTKITKMLKMADLAIYRKQFSVKQKYSCPICKSSLTVGAPALDHCHKTGNVRATLCNSCNMSEGKVKSGVLFRTPKGNLAYRDPITWLRNLADYLEYHQNNPSGIIHPTFDVKTGKQKPKKRKKK